MSDFGVLRFHEGYFTRIWGGTKLSGRLGKPVPPGGPPIGEAWLVSDHTEHESVVADGPHQGRTLRALLEEDAAAVLGRRAALTPHGRFPLLLKLIDAGDALSVQVHPDDATAAALKEPDVGKTEMWHVLDADPGAELICGLEPGLRREAFAAAISDGSLEDALIRCAAPAGASVFVPAGTVHAIGGGLLLAEIQQNSNITYRLYDWGRLDDQGKPRELHVEKALEATTFGQGHSGLNTPLRCERDGVCCEVLAACRYFAAEAVTLRGSYQRVTGGDSFHILLGRTGALTVGWEGQQTTLGAGEALLAPGGLDRFEVRGEGAFLDYYVPGLFEDIVRPLREAGHSGAAIAALGGPPAGSDLAALV